MMTASIDKMIPEDMSSCIIQVERYDNKNLEGTFYNLYYGVALPFENLTRLLLMMEDMMDEMDSPQAAVKSRRFGLRSKQPERDSIAETVPQQNEPEVLATFKVKVLFRQSASWQGTIQWVEENLETSFRSVLELVKLIDSALPQPQSCILHLAEDAG